MKSLQQILDWSEVWALLIPLTILLIYKPKAPWVKPIIFYLLIALVLGAAQDIIWKRRRLGIEDWFLENFSWGFERDPLTGNILLDKQGGPVFKNTIFYNLLSVTRLVFFTWFFGRLGYTFKKLNRFIPSLFLLLVVINFIFFQNIKDFSSRILAVEAAILLFYCMLFFYKVNMDDSIGSPFSLPQSWAVTGLTLYTAINFILFLFYNYLSIQYKAYAVEMWNVHNISYILLNVFIAVALYKAR